MPRRVTRKWRPPLVLVLGGTLAAVFLLPIMGIAYFRVAGGVLGWAETSWLIGWMALVAAALLGALLFRLVLQPVRALTAYAQSEGAADAPTHFGTPEFSRLGQSVIEMTDALRGREAVLRSYADHVTHELKSPLTVIQGAAELLETPGTSSSDRTKLLTNVKNAAARMEALLDGQRALAQAQELVQPGTSYLSEVLCDLEGATFVADAEVPLPREVMDVVAGHLVNNALSHGATEVTFEMSEERLLISDDGRGISAGNRDQIFDPFFTTRRGEGGTGMGLSIVRQMLGAQGAAIRLRDEARTTFEISFVE